MYPKKWPGPGPDRLRSSPAQRARPAVENSHRGRARDYGGRQGTTQRRIIGNAGVRHRQCGATVDRRLTCTNGGLIQTDAIQSIARGELGELVQTAFLDGVGRHDQLAALAVGHAVPRAQCQCRCRAGAAQLGFETARRVVDPGMNDAAVVPGLVTGHTSFFFEHGNAAARMQLLPAVRGGQTDDAGADDGEIQRCTHGLARAGSQAGVRALLECGSLNAMIAIEPMPTASNITWHNHQVSRAARQQLNGHRGVVLWFTGLSGAGKSTLANAVDTLLHHRRVHTYLLDGDNIRYGLNGNLGFSTADRCENIRRIGEVSKLMADAGLVTLSAFISPYRADREQVRALLAPGEFIEILVKASLATCEARDPKGLYRKARAGEISGFTGIDAPYEAPLAPEIVLDTDVEDVASLAAAVIAYLERHGVLAGVVAASSP